MKEISTIYAKQIKQTNIVQYSHKLIFLRINGLIKDICLLLFFYYNSHK